MNRIERLKIGHLDAYFLESFPIILNVKLSKKDNAKYDFSHINSTVCKQLHFLRYIFFFSKNHIFLDLFSHVYGYWKCFHKSKGKGVGVQAFSKKKS